LESPENITGDRIPELLDRFRQEKTILKFNIPGAWNEWLSIILEIRANNGMPFFVIDFPGGPSGDILNSQGKKIIIEFTDENRIHYRLRSVIQSVSRQDISILMPETIHRIQRRGYFRVSSPIDTKVIIRDEIGSLDLNVVNISEGGVLASNPAASHNSVRFFKGAFKGISIIYKENEGKQGIAIKKTEIRRVVKRPETGCYEYAFMFLDRGRDIEKEIRKFIYSCQRKILYRKKYPEEDPF
jgi:c-di-GMP-binding flagellar brake protein YcgR